MSGDKDKVIIELFDSLRELAELRRKYDGYIREGYVNLAKARYDIGSRTGGIISHLQYPNKMEASTCIECHDNDHQDLFQLHNTGSSGVSTSGDDTSQTSSSQIRQRKGKEMAPNKIKATSSIQHRIDNPIKWFSVLPPMSLRHSQERFKQGLEVVVLMANVQSHVEDLRKTFVEMTRTIY